jgi:hypothetical protein
MITNTAKLADRPVPDVCEKSQIVSKVDKFLRHASDKLDSKKYFEIKGMHF